MSDQNESAQAPKRKAGRSPAYPFINVKKALERVQALYEQEGEYAAPMASATQAWGYSSKSSGARRTLATMKYYGLVDVSGEGDTQKIKVSDIARRVILDQREDETEKRQLVRKVSLNPAAHKAIFDEYPSGLASDGSVIHFLIFDSGFKKDAANELLAQFKETASYAGLYQSGVSVDKARGPNHDGDAGNEVSIKIDDKIQWTNQGVDQFPEGGTVLGFSDDGQWVFTDQSDRAVSISEVTIMEHANTPDAPKMPPAPPAHVAAAIAAANKARLSQGGIEVKEGSRKAVFPVEDGDVTLIFPENISADGLSELGQYLEIFLKKEQKKQESDR